MIAHSPFRTMLACALAIAACAMVAAALIAADEARAGSGGVATAAADNEPPADSRATKYARLWEQTSRQDRRWAHSTAQCESGGDPKAIGAGGLYRGAFQFMRQTWNSAPKSPGGDPIDYSYRTQAVVAVALKHADGAGHWPNCG